LVEFLVWKVCYTSKMINAKYHREYYHRNKEKILSKKIAGQKIRRQIAIKHLRDYKGRIGCLDCGEKNPIVLDFDHKYQDTKKDSVSNMVKSNYGMEKIMAEVNKCEVVCANCHRIRTHKQCGWF